MLTSTNGGGGGGGSVDAVSNKSLKTSFRTFSKSGITTGPSASGDSFES